MRPADLRGAHRRGSEPIVRRRKRQAEIPREVRPRFWADVAAPSLLAGVAVACYATWLSPEVIAPSLLTVLPVAGALAINWLVRIARGPHSLRESFGLVGLLNAPAALWLAAAGLAAREGSGLAWWGLVGVTIALGVGLAAFALGQAGRG